MYAWKYPKPKNNVSFNLNGFFKSNGTMAMENSFPTDTCKRDDKSCIQIKKNMIISECSPVLSWINVSIDWVTLKWQENPH